MSKSAMSDVLIIGGGPAGLTAARELRALGVADVVVVEREQVAGGIPRHSDHTGYGLRDLRTVMTGPKYAALLADKAEESGAVIRTGTMVTNWCGDRSVELTSRHGRERFDARAIILATGARERPRAARMIPGDRPNGVLNTGTLQQLVHLRQRSVGTRAVIVGSELVSWSAVITLREVGCETVAMVTEHDRIDAYAALAVPGQLALRVPMAKGSRVVRIIGRDRVTGVEIEQVATGRRRIIECDTVVLTGDWIPDYELAALRGLDIDPASRAPIVDTALRTGAPGIFAAGNLVHPVDTADVAALDGRHVARQVVAYLHGGDAPAATASIIARPPFAWVSPMRYSPTAPARDRLLLWCEEYVRLPRVMVRQGSRTLSRRTIPWPLAPGRMFRLPWSALKGAQGDEDIVISLG